MNEGGQPPYSGAATRTRTHTSDLGARSTADLRVPGLTVLFHPELDRVGERAVLAGLTSGARCSLSRLAPDFAAPGSATPRPLVDACLSRTPIELRGDGGSLFIDRAESRTHVEVCGRPATTTVELAVDGLEEGVVLILGGHIVLLLHLLDPVADTSTPRFGMVDESPALTRLRRDIVQTADLDVPILLRGESGTGKELVARAIHDAGPRRDGPWVAVNMGAVPPSLDLDARIRALKLTEQQLEELLVESRSAGRDVEGIMEIFQELTRVREEREKIHGRLAAVQDLVALSKIAARITPTGDPPDKGLSWGTRETADNAIHLLLLSLRTLLRVVIYAAIVVLPLGLLLAVLVYGARLTRRRFRRH